MDPQMCTTGHTGLNFTPPLLSISALDSLYNLSYSICPHHEASPCSYCHHVQSPVHTQEFAVVAVSVLSYL